MTQIEDNHCELPTETAAAGDQRDNVPAAILPFILAGVIGIGVLGAGIWLWAQENKPPVGRSAITEPFANPPELDDFTLTERSGSEFHSPQMLGDVWVASFFFTTCPGSCEKLNQHIAAMQRDDELAGVRWVSITVDPDTDTLETLNRYADRFKADPKRWLFCRGSMEYTESLGKEAFKLPVGFKGHNDYGVVIDRQGRIRNWLNINSRRDRAKLRDLLVECLEEEVPKDDVQNVESAEDALHEPETLEHALSRWR